jgi:uncharacterized membrane protein
MSKTKKITLSAVVIALYIILMYITQNFAFGQYQVRIATGLYALGYQFPFLIIPLGIANLLSNTIMGGLGLLDMIGGCIAGIITTLLIVWFKKLHMPKYIIVLPIALVPSLLVPIWLSIILNVPYLVLFISLLVGHTISAFTLGLLIVNLKLEK